MLDYWNVYSSWSRISFKRLDRFNHRSFTLCLAHVCILEVSHQSRLFCTKQGDLLRLLHKYLSRLSVSFLTYLSFLCFPLYISFLPESPRWLLSKGKYKRAYEVMANIARVNGKEVPPDLMQQLLDLNRQKEKTRRDSIISSGRRRSVVVKDSSVNNDFEVSQEGSFADIFRCPGLRKKFLILTFSWIANVCSYRGLTLNFENFHGNEFINWLLLSVVEFPSNLLCWALMETRLGRRWTNSIFMTLGGIALCVPLLIPDSAATAIIIASLAGKFLTNMAYNVVYQQTAELFPTPVRNQAMSYMTAIAAGANFALPYLASQVRSYFRNKLVSSSKFQTKTLPSFRNVK